MTEGIDIITVESLFHRARELFASEEISLIDCKTFLSQAADLMGAYESGPSFSITGVRDFFKEAESYIYGETITTDEVRKFLDKAQMLIKSDTTLADARSFIEDAESLARDDMESPTPTDCANFLQRAKELVVTTDVLREQTRIVAFLDSAKDLLITNAREQFEYLKERCPDVNVLHIFGIAKKEMPHSYFLAWLLNPNETHRLGDTFLKALIGASSKTFHFEANNDIKVKTEMETEKLLRLLEGENIPEVAKGKRLDIVVWGKDFLIIIENKLTQGDYRRQTKIYADYADLSFPQCRKLLILLAPGMCCKKDDRFEIIPHLTIAHILEDILEKKKEGISRNTRFLIDQFLFNLRYNITKNLYGKLKELVVNGSDSDQYLLDHYDELSQIYRYITI